MKIAIPREYVVWDLETSGLDPQEDKILEVAALKIRDGQVVEKYEAILNHGIEIAEAVSRVNHLTKDICEKEGIDPKEGMIKLARMIVQTEKHVTHNGFKFDIPFLINSLEKLGIPEESMTRLKNKCTYDHIDTAVIYKGHKLGKPIGDDEAFIHYCHQITRIFAKGVKYNVSIACEELGIDKTAVVQHSAGGDIELTNEILKKLCVLCNS